MTEDQTKRRYLPNKVKGKYRYILMRGEYKKINMSVHYQQFLVLELLELIAVDKKNSQSNDSVFHKLLLELVFDAAMPNYAQDGRYMNNREVYIMRVAEDLMTLKVNGVLDDKLLRRIATYNDSEVRGALYEASVAAAFSRLGYEIEWIHEDGRPEFTATRDGVSIDVEAKRRNRHRQSDVVPDLSFKRELGAMRKNIDRAFKKKRSNPYVIFFDNDFPPASSIDRKELYNEVAVEYLNKDLGNSAIMLTNSGYEYLVESTDGRNSAMLIKDSRHSLSLSAEVLKEILTSFTSNPPPAVSIDWTVE